MSFYCGLVAKLVAPRHLVGIFEVVELLHIDTANDANMHINFSHEHVTRAMFIPVSEIEGFVNGTTTTVSRIFNFDLGIETWKSNQ